MYWVIVCWCLSWAEQPKAQVSSEPNTWLFVKTEPAGAEVVLDGRSVGKTNLLVEVQPGGHQLRLQLTGYAAEEIAVDCPAGKVTRVEKILRVFREEKPSGSAPPSSVKPVGSGNPRTDVERLIKEALRQAEEGEMGSAQETLAQGRQIAQKITDDSLKDWMLAELAKAHARLKDWGGAASCLFMMIDGGRYVEAAYEVVILRAKSGDFAGAKAWANHTDEGSLFSPNHIRARGELFTTLTAMLETKSKLALEEIRKIERQGGPPPGPELPPAMQRSEIERLIREAGRQAESGQTGAARESLSQARQIAGKIAEQSLRDWAFGELAKAYAQWKDFANAVACTLAIDGAPQQIDTAYEVVLMQARSGDYAGARITCERLLGTGGWLADGRWERFSSFTDSARAKAESVLKEIKKLEEKSQERHSKPEALPKPAASPTQVSDIAQPRREVEQLLKEAASQAEAGDMGTAQETLAKARQIATNIPEQSLRDWVFTELAKAQAQIKDFPGAIVSVCQIKTPIRYIDAAYQVVIFQAQKEDYVGALVTHKKLFEDFPHSHPDLWNEICQSPKPAAALEEVAKLQEERGVATAAQNEVKKLVAEALKQSEVGDMAGAHVHLGKALSVAKTIVRESLRYSCLGEVAKASAQIGDFNGVRDTLKEMKPGEVRSILASEVAIILAQGGHFQEAYSVAETFIEYSVQTFAGEFTSGISSSRRDNTIKKIEGIKNLREKSPSETSKPPEKPIHHSKGSVP